MKKTLMAMVLVGVFSGNLCVAAPAPEQVAKMAQKGSGTSFDALCVAVYEAVKAAPNNAVEIFKPVMMQRESWTATETYSVLRSVLLAAPSLEDGFVANAQAYNNNPGSYVPVAVESAGYQLLATLYTMPQTQPVAGTVAQGVAATTITGTSAGNGVSSDSLESFVPNAPATTPEEDVLVTPPATSALN